MDDSGSLVDIPPLSLPLETDRLLLREYTPADADTVYAYARAEAYHRYLPIDTPTPESAAEFVEKSIKLADDHPRMEYELAVHHQKAQRIIGGVHLTIKDTNNREGEIGYALDPVFHGHGLMTEAVRRLIEAAIDEIGLFRLSAVCDTKNTGSAALLERVGMTREGRLRGHMVVRGKRSDSYLYALLKTDRKRP